MKKKVLLGLLCGVLVLGLSTGCGNKENNTNSENNNNNTNQGITRNFSIKDMRISLSNIIALTNNNELYVYGEDNYGELVATIAIGTGLVGRLSGADFKQIICGMHDSKQQIILHAGYSLDTILECYNEEKVKIKK